jgi:hypothetical protein
MNRLQGNAAGNRITVAVYMASPSLGRARSTRSGAELFLASCPRAGRHAIPRRLAAIPPWCAPLIPRYAVGTDRPSANGRTVWRSGFAFCRVRRRQAAPNGRERCRCNLRRPHARCSCLCSLRTIRRDASADSGSSLKPALSGSCASVPIPKFASAIAAKGVRTSGSRH